MRTLPQVKATPDLHKPMTEQGFLAWTQAVLEVTDTADATAILEVLITHPYQVQHAQHLISAFAKSMPATPSTQELESHLALQEALHMWKDDHADGTTCITMPVIPEISRISLQQVRLRPAPPADPAGSQLDHRRTKLNDRWANVDVVHQLRKITAKDKNRRLFFPRPVERPISSAPIYLYIFSGRRRDYDFQHFVEHYLCTWSLQGVVVLIDLAISAKHDVGNPELITKLRAMLQQGAVQGLLLAPPCETWSQARFQRNHDRDPRPLRSSEDLWCISGLTAAELQQVETANMLLGVALQLLYIAALTHTPAVLEHPALPSKPGRPSIWLLPWMTELLASQLVTRTLIHQAAFGGVALKPTHLAHCWVPELTTQLHSRKQPIDWSSLISLTGKDQRGSWFTARAKEYPSLLNDVFACSFVMTQKEASDNDKLSAPLPPSLSSIVADLTADNRSIDEQTMQPDYGRSYIQLGTLD